MHSLYLWIGFNVFVVVMLALDLVVFHKKAHAVRMKEALGWSAFWIALAMVFATGVYYFLGHQKGLEFLTGYLIEKSLSVDNLFVFLVIFGYFKIEQEYQHRILFWGILGALIFRAIFIFAGVALIQKFHWIIYVFGAFLIYTGFKMAFSKGNEDVHPENNPVIKLIYKLIPVLPTHGGGKMFLKQNGKWFATQLFIVLCVVETTDIVFAVDSIPAILAISVDPFIVYTSNVFAILGLRALYFALAGVVGLFHLLHYGLALVLMFVGTKMIIAEFYKVPIFVSLGVIFLVLTLSIVLSMMFPVKEKLPHPPVPLEK
jgi:tellurite resistance protein TerC